MASTPACLPGGISTKRSATGAANTPATRMATGSARCPSTRSRGSGPCCAPGSARPGGSRRRSCRSIWGSSSSCTTHAVAAKPSSARSLPPWSQDSPDQHPGSQQEPLEKALHEEPRPGAARKLTGQEEALLVATACSRPPAGRARWTIELLAGEMVRLTDHESVSRETVRRRLAENELKPWREKMWCVPKIDGEYVARTEDVLDLYAAPPDPARPVVCLDESPVQLIGEVREPIPAAPGQLARVDYEYCRNGTVNLFVAVDAHRSWRKVSVTERRTARDYAERLRELVDVDDPDAACIRVVQDNLSTHTPGSLYETFPAAEAHRILERLEFHYTPKHASWLNMVEIEIGVLKGQCLDRRINNQEDLEGEIAAWERQRNASGARTKPTSSAVVGRSRPRCGAT